MRSLISTCSLWLSLFVSMSLTANPNIDSLENELTRVEGDSLKVQILNQLCWAYKNFNPGKGLEYGKKALALARENNFIKPKSTAYLNMGGVYMTQGNYTEALNCYLESLKINEKSGDKEGTAASLNNLGAFYGNQNNLEKALSYYLSSLKIREEIGNKRGISSNLNNIGAIYGFQKDYDKSLDYFSRSLLIGEELNDKGHIALCLSNIGSIYWYKNDYQQALDYHSRALDIRQEMGDKRGIAITHNNIGVAFQKLGDYSTSKAYHLKALDGAKAIGAKKIIQDTYKNLAENAAARKDFPEAYSYHQQFTLVKDSLFDEDKNRKIAEMQAKYKAEKNEKEIQLLKQQNEIQVEKLTTQKIIRNSFIGGFILILVISFLIYNRYHIRKKANKTLKSTNIQLQTAKDRAEKSEKLMEQFLMNMSHEIRTPMNAVLGMTHMMLNTRLSDDQLKYINTIKFAADNLLVIINDILDLSRIEAGKLILEQIHFNIRDLINGVMETVNFKAQDKGLRLNFSLDENVPEYLIGDPVRLNQVLLNLINNAIKFTPKGEVSLTISILSKQDTDVELAFDIADTGIGIPEDKLEHIFERFAQASTDTTRNYGGTGLGLTISRKLVELQGGQIRVASREGQGTTFTFHMRYPIGQKQQVIKEEPKSIPSELLTDIAVLLVEDDEFNREVAVELLRSWKNDIAIDIAKNGKEAIQLVKQNAYHMILMDVQMPEMDGYQATRYIRSELPAPGSDTPIIAMSAHAGKAEIDKCLAAGMNDHISKPFTPSTLYRKITEQITKG